MAECLDLVWDLSQLRTFVGSNGGKLTFIIGLLLLLMWQVFASTTAEGARPHSESFSAVNLSVVA